MVAFIIGPDQFLDAMEGGGQGQGVGQIQVPDQAPNQGEPFYLTLVTSGNEHNQYRHQGGWFIANNDYSILLQNNNQQLNFVGAGGVPGNTVTYVFQGPAN